MSVPPGYVGMFHEFRKDSPIDQKCQITCGRNLNQSTEQGAGIGQLKMSYFIVLANFESRQVGEGVSIQVHKALG
jgi:hypothetical protein